jgi:hypothetical protein
VTGLARRSVCAEGQSRPWSGDLELFGIVRISQKAQIFKGTTKSTGRPYIKYLVGVFGKGDVKLIMCSLSCTLPQNNVSPSLHGLFAAIRDLSSLHLD